MRFGLKATLLAGALAGTLAGPVASAGAAPPTRTVTAHYLITWLGLPVYEARFVATVGPRRYAATAFARSLGIVELVAPSRINIAAKGRIERGRYRPGRVEQRFALRHGKHRQVTMTYPASHEVDTSITPPESPGKRKPVPPALRKDTIDPLTAVLNAVMSPLDARPCVYLAKIFDGRRRVDAWLGYGGVTRTPPAPVAALPPRAVLCMLHAKRVAGFTTKHLRLLPVLRPAQLWVVRLERARLWLPVDLRLPTKWGAIHARLIAFSAAGRQRAAR